MNYALITGASGGIGKAICTSLLENDFNIIMVARSFDKLTRVRDEFTKLYKKNDIRIVSCDVSAAVDVKNLFKNLDDDIKISVLVNAAGISGGGITAEIDDALWTNVINTNLNGTFFVTRECLRLDLIPVGGKIINIASTGGKQGVIYAAPYCASKHGMVGFSKALGLELARNKSGITVNAICPGFVETEMAERVRKHYAKIWDTTEDEAKKRVEERVPLGRYIEPSEVAGMLSYLISPAANGITAQAFNICGGLGNY